MDTLLDRVLDEYGLIVCGWSAQWDRALRAAFERRHSRRFSVYWVSRGEPNEDAKRLIELGAARVILSEGADFFFPALAEKVRALRDLEASDPLPPAMAAATVKRYLAEDRYRIRLNDLVGEAIREAAEDLIPRGLPSPNNSPHRVPPANESLRGGNRSPAAYDCPTLPMGEMRVTKLLR